MQELLTSDQNVTKSNEPATGSVVSYVINLVRDARDTRNTNYKAKWDQFERCYRGIYGESDAIREGERSKIISPALTQAIDSIHASIMDAIFSREEWIDIKDDKLDQDSEDIQWVRKNLKEDLELTNTHDNISKIVLNGCLYGTGIGKINVIKKRVPTINAMGPLGPEINWEDRPLVSLEPIPPWEFVKDSNARDMDLGLFCGHETHVPRNVVWTKQIRGVYRKNAKITGFNAGEKPFPAGEPSVEERTARNDDDGAVWVTEYYGLIPAKMVRAEGVDVGPDDIQGNGMVECIATIGNETELLRLVKNPFTMKDRPIVAYQHTYVPGKWWGEGVAGKGWNAQQGLDAELRARMDALGLLTSPMMGADITRLPRNPDMRVRPGKVWLTRGRPSEVLEPIALGNIDPNTFNQSSEMERLVQVATGAIESNAPLNSDQRNQTASGISMIQSSALKRQRAVMANIERQFLNPFIRKSVWRLMQFNPQRYPADYEFCIKGTMGIVAREFEQASLTGLLSVIPPESPAHSILLRGIIELSGAPQRDEMLKALDAAMQPTPEQKEQEQIKMESLRQQLQELQLENQKTQMETAKLQAEIQKIMEETRLLDEEMDLNAAKTAADIRKSFADQQKAKAEIKSKEEDRKSQERIAKHQARQKAKTGGSK